MIVNANGDTVVSNNFTSASAVFNNGTNSTNGIKVVSSTTASVFTGGIEFIRTTVAGGSKIQPLRDAAIGGVGFDFLVTANNAAEISASYTSALQILNNGAATFSNSITALSGIFGNSGSGSYSLRIANNDQSNVRLNIVNSGSGGQEFSIIGGLAGASNAGFSIYDNTNASTRFYINSTGVIALSNLAGTGTRMVVADASGNLSTQAIGSGSITGSGTTNYLPKFTGASTIGNSAITDDGATVTLISRALSGTSAVFNNALSAYSLTSVNTIKGSAYVELSPDQTTYNAWNIRVGAQAADACYYITGGGVNIMTTEGYSVPYTVKLYSNGVQTLTMTNGVSTFSGSVTATQFIVGSATTSSDVSVRYKTDTGDFSTINDRGAHAFGIYDHQVSLYRMYINTSGNVGVNTTSPSTLFQAVNNTNDSATFSSRWSSSGYYAQLEIRNYSANLNNQDSPQFRISHNFNDNLNNGYIGFHRGGGLNGGFLSFGTDGIQRVRITSGGSVGINTESPVTRLDVYDSDNSGTRTSPINIVTITADNNSNPYDGFGGGLLFKNRIYGGGPSPGGMRDGARIRTSLRTNSSVNLGTQLVFDVTATGDGALTEALRLGNNGATFSNNVSAGTSINWNNGIGALSYNTGLVTMETNSATRIELKTNGTTALTLQTNQNARFANLLGIGRDPSHALDALGSIRGSDRLYWNGLSQLVYILNYDQINNADTTTISDSTATNGFALRKTGGSSTFFFGNYTSFPPGNYTAYFRLKVASNASGSSLGTLDVVGGTMIGFSITLRPNMFAASDTWQYIKLPFTVTGSGYIEWRLVSWTGITDTFFDHIMVYQEGGEGNVFTRSAYSVYVNQNTLGMQLNTSGAMTVTGSVTATSFFESSDERLKSNIIDLDTNVSSIIAKSYLKNGMKEIGYLAQDVERILPSAISKRDDGYLDLSYRQVHTAKIAALEKEVFELKKQLKNK
jgi:hypothetical protein